MSYSCYYQVHVVRKECWYFVAILRSYEHLAFDRTLDKEKSIFEVFVPLGLEHYLEELLDYFMRVGVVTHIEKLPNRLKDPAAIV